MSFEKSISKREYPRMNFKKRISKKKNLESEFGKVNFVKWILKHEFWKVIYVKIEFIHYWVVAYPQPPRGSIQGAMKHEVLESCLVHMVHNWVEKCKIKIFAGKNFKK